MIYIICLCIAIGVLALDLITKYIAVSQNFNVVIIPELLKFKLTYNTGASFSFLADKSWAIYMFIAITILVCLFILGFYLYHIFKKQKPSKWLAVTLAMVFSGALGNLIDRIFFSGVRDFIYLKFLNFAIFNVADMAIVCSVIVFCVFLIIDTFKKEKK